MIEVIGMWRDGPKPPKSGTVDDSDPPTALLTWAQRPDVPLKAGLRVRHHALPSAVDGCGGRLRVIAGATCRRPPADVTDPAVIRKILDPIHQPAPPEQRTTPQQCAISSARGRHLPP